MSRAQRLLDLIQELRRHRRPVSGAALADTMGTSLRTIYRDIETLKAQGAHIDGEAGVGFVLRPGFMLPPMMFTEEEIEALVLGSRWVAERTDTPLGKAARNALTKIAAVLPADLKESLDGASLLIGPGPKHKPPITAVGEHQLPAIRACIREERKIKIRYTDAADVVTRRTIWPIALAFFDRVRVVVAWCEARKDFRHFRTDRIGALVEQETRYPKRRQALLREWRAKEGLSET
jgi:predicted DNA-binding transcriptional regulator YafY